MGRVSAIDCFALDLPYNCNLHAMFETAPASSRKRRVSSSTLETRRRICLAAEALIGQRGPDAVSLREIAVAAGQRNKIAVAYHFGDKANLINEVVCMRVAELEVERQALLDEAKARGKANDLRTLVHCMFHPTLSIIDANGVHVYSRFQLQIMSSKYITNQLAIWPADDYPARVSIVNLMKKEMNCESLLDYGYKLIIASTIFNSCVKLFDDRHKIVGNFESMTKSLDHAYDLMANCFRL